MDSSRHRSHHSRLQGSSSPNAPAPSSSRRHRHHRATSAHHESRPHRQKRPHSPSPPQAPVRPFKAPVLSKHSYDAYREVFADYLDIQKGLILADLDRAEVKGRFKSFVKHYNRGELARGWYERIVNYKGGSGGAAQKGEVPQPEVKKQRVEVVTPEDEEDSSGSDGELVGPFLPGHEPRKRSRGPTVPTREDLDLQKEQLDQDLSLARLDLHHARKQDLKLQKERLDELLPRADPASHERKLEKKKAITEKLKPTRERSPEVDDSTLMGGTDSFKQKKAAIERKKNDRELRKEQILRVRVAEREERLQQHRDKEEKTMAMLRQLAARYHN